MLIVAIILMIAALGVAELGLRLMPEGATYRDTALPRVRKGPWQQPEFRNRVYQQEKAPGVFRIFALGDSYTWGSGVYPEDAYPDRLEDRLADLAGDTEFEVVNWSRPGWSSFDEWSSVRNRLRKWSPDLLIVGFVFNDPEAVRLTPDQREDLFARHPEDGLAGWLYRHSRAVSGVVDVFENRRVRRALIDYYHGLFADPEGWERCKEALAGLRDRARNLGIPFLVVVFPIFDSQIDGDYPYHDLHDLMLRTTAELEIDSFDLRPAYAGVDAYRLALTPFTDPHPSELAQRIAADAIQAELLRREWLPAPATDTSPSNR